MAADRAKKPATYQDLAKLPEHMVGEIMGGELFVTPRPAPAHSLAASAIGGQLWDPFGRPTGRGGPGGWWILDEPELHLGPDVVVPDLAGWKRERMAELPAGPAIELGPDWVCEVISPSTARFDRTRKMPIFARAGVCHLWLVDPLARTLEVFRLENGRWSLIASHGEDTSGLMRIEPFDAIEVDVARWWVS